jgi:hypothetical protein
LLEFAEPVAPPIEQQPAYQAPIEESPARAMPRNLPEARRMVAELAHNGLPLPDEVQEAVLLLELKANPFDVNFTRALVAVRDRLGKAPMPDSPVPDTSSGDIDRLLQEGARLSQYGDIFWDFASLWQIVVRYPNSPRGWAEYARRFARRYEWENCRLAAQKVLGWPRQIDQSSAVALLEALSALALNDQLADMDWRAWLEHLPLSLQHHPFAAGLKLWAGDAANAMALLPSIVRFAQPDARGWIVAANIAFEQEHWDEAYQFWCQALATDLRTALRSAFNEHPARLSYIVRQTGNENKLANWLAEQWRAHEGVNLIPLKDEPESEQQMYRLRKNAMDRGLPSVFMAAQAKSGSVSVANLFNSGFDLAFAAFSLMDTAIVAPWLFDYMRGGASYITHLPPSERNIELLTASGVSRIIVHTRDPRQLLVSMAGHTGKYAADIAPSYRTSGGMKDAVATVLRDRIGEVVGWIDGWLRARDRLTVEFTTFEEFVSDREAFVERCLALYGGERRYFDAERGLQEQPGVDYHRRSGRVDEWREMLTRDQVKRINQAIPDRLWNEFGWNP